MSKRGQDESSFWKSQEHKNNEKLIKEYREKEGKTSYSQWVADQAAHDGTFDQMEYE